MTAPNTAAQNVELATALAAHATSISQTVEYTEGRTTYTATVVSGKNVTWDTPDHSRLTYTVSVTRTTSRSSKTFTAHVSREVGNFTSHTSSNETNLRVSHLHNEDGNAVFAAQFNGYRTAALMAAQALEAEYTA